MWIVRSIRIVKEKFNKLNKAAICVDYKSEIQNFRRRMNVNTLVFIDSWIEIVREPAHQNREIAVWICRK